MASVPPRLLAAIRREPAYLQEALLTTALIESGGRLNAVGDGGRSHGPYQEYDLGRGAGLSVAQRRDPFASTRRAAQEFQTFYDRGARGGSLAYRAQRPADREHYLERFDEFDDVARQLLAGQGGSQAAAPAGGGGGGGGGGGAAAPAPMGMAGGVDPRLSMIQALRALRDPEGDRIGALSELVSLRQQQAGASPGPIASDADAAAAQAAGVPVGAVGGLTMGGGPDAHAGRALGNWQSDNAYDLMGKAGQSIYSPVTGRVVKVSGSPGGSPQFAGYGVTVRTGQGDLFFKHLGSTPLSPGDQLRRGNLVGALDAATAGGPHLHLGGQNRGLLDRIARAYTGGGR